MLAIMKNIIKRIANRRIGKKQRKREEVKLSGKKANEINDKCCNWALFSHASATFVSSSLCLRTEWWWNAYVRRNPLPFEKWLFYAPIFCKLFSVFTARAKDMHINYLLSTRTSRQVFFYFSPVFARTCAFQTTWCITSITVCVTCIWYVAARTDSSTLMASRTTDTHRLECENVPHMWAFRNWSARFGLTYNFRLSSDQKHTRFPLHAVHCRSCRNGKSSRKTIAATAAYDSF